MRIWPAIIKISVPVALGIRITRGWDSTKSGLLLGNSVGIEPAFRQLARDHQMDKIS